MFSHWKQLLCILENTVVICDLDFECRVASQETFTVSVQLIEAKCRPYRCYRVSSDTCVFRTELHTAGVEGLVCWVWVRSAGEAVVWLPGLVRPLISQGLGHSCPSE